ncbi:hypothetical protein E2C01_023903 [Portunus trituberculatus]|uniref:Uncharacterized protein n=1 Tax=Portunus trituberculatus TaxID=210409 RepID=A0A5B7EBB0_PORTR|nr:hypothetical protein [Portunus trituberculatus]
MDGWVQVPYGLTQLPPRAPPFHNLSHSGSTKRPSTPPRSWAANRNLQLPVVAGPVKEDITWDGQTAENARSFFLMTFFHTAREVEEETFVAPLPLSCRAYLITLHFFLQEAK